MTYGEHERLLERALAARREVLHEIRHGGLSQRAMLRRVALAGAALAALQAARVRAADATIDLAPRVPGFIDPLPHPNRPENLARPEPLPLDPLPTRAWRRGSGEAPRAAHQGWRADSPAREVQYRIVQRPARHRFHSQLPEADIWGFDGKLPGPTFHGRYGRPMLVRIVNQLPYAADHVGHGMPETSTHLHNGHNPSESDGNPDDYFPRNTELNAADRHDLRWRDHHYPNLYAGGDPAEALGTLWYHDHRHGFTSQNVARGLAGFFLMFDERDNGDENTSDSRALRLPSGEYDLPLMLTDHTFDTAGQVQFDPLNLEGLLGNAITVNGKYRPRFQAARRRYRLRVLNASLTRVYGLALMTSPDPDGNLANAVPLAGRTGVTGPRTIGVSGNLLPAPVAFRQNMCLAPAQRVDLVVDMNEVPAGHHLYLVNVYEHSDPRLPTRLTQLGTDGPVYGAIKRVPIVRFDIDPTPANDPSQLPAQLRDLPALPAGVDTLTVDQIMGAIGRSKPFPGVETVRRWIFDRNNGQWTVNSRLFDGSRPAAQIGQGTAEIWVFHNAGHWVHPIHMHGEHFRTLYRGNGNKPRPGSLSYSREDTMMLAEHEDAIGFMRFRDWKGKYVMHCHNLTHEDHAMMIRFDIV